MALFKENTARNQQWCPFVPRDQDVDGQSLKTAACLGSFCMAWRNCYVRSDNCGSDILLGYCGLAGSPTATDIREAEAGL